jgi:hypothetical protein
MTQSMLDEDSIKLVREYVAVYGQQSYEWLCDHHAGEPDSRLISHMKRLLYGTEET